MSEHTRIVPIEAEYPSPGPLAYMLRPTVGSVDHDVTMKQEPAWSLGVKPPVPVNRNPGPGYPIGDRITHRGRQDPPAYSLSGRPKPKGLEPLPGPNHYNSALRREGTISQEPTVKAVTMGSRDAWYNMKNFAPAPSRYRVDGGIGTSSSHAKNSVRWSMYGRMDYGSPHYEGAVLKRNAPGPAAYGSTDASCFKKRPASYSLQGRTKIKDYDSSKQNPAPGSYNPIPLRSGRSNGCTIGVRHSPHTVLCLTAADIH